MKNFKLLLQILTVIIIASFAGAMMMLYTSLIPFWEELAPEEFLNWFSRYSTGIEVTTGLFVKLSMLLPLICIILVWKLPKCRNLWIISYALIIGIMVITISFFIEANTSFVSKNIDLDTVKSTISTWGQLHLIRTIIGFISAFFAGIGLIKYCQVFR